MSPVKKIIVFIICLIVAYFFLIDIAIKALLEQQGSKALRAKLDIASATFHLLPASLTLRGVQATNPQQPDSNLFEADSIALPLQLSELLDRKLLVAAVEVHGLRFARPRARSGAINGLTPPAANVAANAALPDAKQLQLQQTEQRHSYLQRAQQDLIALRNDWQQRLRSLPTATQLQDFRFRAQSKDANNRNRLRADLNDELANARKLQEQFALDFARAQPELNYSVAPQSTGTVQLATGAQASLTAGLLGHELQPLLQHILGFITSAPAIENSDGEAAKWQLLARKINVDGEINLGTAPLHFTGVVENVTPQPHFFDVSTHFIFQNSTSTSSNGQPEKFSAEGNLDYRKLPLQNIRFNLSDFSLEQMPLSREPALQITVTKALTDIQGLLSVTGNQIDINVLVRFQNAELQIASDDSALGRAAAATLKSVRDFDLNFQASGDVNNPIVKLNSSLDTLLANALRNEMSAQSNNNGDSATSAPELIALRQVAADIQQLQQTLLAAQSELQQLLNF
ncbi:MAG: hypothetical protein JWM78_3552 [Verrucomicrobiaceae bacterium]|nr:hypothetical protein [Verrucomicrobiaceae bacterium]